MNQLDASPEATARGESGFVPMPLLDGIETPVPVVDLDVVERNVARLQALCDAAGVANRPHIKTHKSVELARLQMAAGAAGITCQKLGEAETMADAGIDDILVSYNIIGAPKLQRLRTLSQRISLTVSCDNPVVTDGLAAAMQGAPRRLKVLVECDTGRKRCGVVTPAEAAALASRIAQSPGLSFDGLLLYPPAGDTAPTRAFLAETRRLCAGSGLDLATVSAGGTPNLSRIGEAGETEYRSGTSIYNDRQMLEAGAASREDCAFFVHATVVSRPETGRLLIDAGSKTLTSDLQGLSGFGVIADYPGALIYQFAEEHGFVDVSRCTHVPEIGEIVRVLPNHVCPVSNLFDRVLTTRGGRATGWLTIDARGKVA